MNFKKLQAMQLELDNSILSAKPEMTAEERFNKTLVALSVEVAEVANCSEHFKFWKDNKDKFLEYTQRLGITTQELEQAYYEKNEENYRRLREGY